MYLVHYYLVTELKKITSLLFIVLFLFNLFGYRFVFDYAQQKANDQMEVNLDNNLYNEADLIELKVAMNLPYQTSWADYKRCDGEIEIGGIRYKYVKQKVSNDTLYVMCIPNTKKMHLENLKNDLAQMANGVMQNDNSSKSNKAETLLFKNLQSVYDDYIFVYNLMAPAANSSGLFQGIHSADLITLPHVSPEQPPDLSNA